MSFQYCKKLRVEFLKKIQFKFENNLFPTTGMVRICIPQSVSKIHYGTFIDCYIHSKS